MQIITLQVNLTDTTTKSDYITSSRIVNDPNGLFNESDAHFTAEWILEYLITQPSGYITNPLDLNSYGMCNSFERNAAIKRLVHLGYLIIERIDSQNRTWHVYDTPQNRTCKNIYVSSMGGK
jgi:hypothetical protein